MKTDPTASISSTNGAAAMSLTYQTIASENRATNETKLKPKAMSAIHDLVETSDRESDGRAPLPLSNKNGQNSASNTLNESGGLLDLTG